jgi:hypothetical protein
MMMMYNTAEEIWGEPNRSGRLPTSFANGKGSWLNPLMLKRMESE